MMFFKNEFDLYKKNCLNHRNKKKIKRESSQSNNIYVPPHA